MADVERLLLSKVIRDQAMPALVEAKITERFFVDHEHLMILKWMQDHWSRYGKSPSEQALQDNYPTYELGPTPEDLPYYIDRLRNQYTYGTLAEAVTDASELLDADPNNIHEVTSVLSVALNDVQTTVSPLRDFNLTDPEMFNALYDRYVQLSLTPGKLRGLSTGFPSIDLATMGLQPGQLVTLVGPPKAGKSTLLLSVANHVNISGNDALFVSFEMSYDETVARYVGMRTHMNYRRLLKGMMNNTDEKRLDLLLEKLKQRRRAQLIMSEDISSTTTVSGIVSKIQQHKPKAVFIDGVYMMEDENGERPGSSQALTNITRALKRVGQVFEIPVVITTQVLLNKMRGQRIETGSIGYTSSFGQDSDVVAALEVRDDPENPGEYHHFLKLLLSRSGPLTETRINFDWGSSNFTEFAPVDFSHGVDPDSHDTGEIHVV